MPSLTFILLGSSESKILAPPVAVKVAVFGFGAPYSVGFLNCFSLDILCEEVAAMTFLTKPPSIRDDASNIPSTLVAQALYIPRKDYSSLMMNNKKKLFDLTGPLLLLSQYYLLLS